MNLEVVSQTTSFFLFSDNLYLYHYEFRGGIDHGGLE